jgi:hypothetical protein
VVDAQELTIRRRISLIGMRLSGDGSRLRVRNAGDLVAIVNTRTFAVSEPGEPAKAASEPHEEAGFPWLVLLPVAGLGGLAL